MWRTLTAIVCSMAVSGLTACTSNSDEKNYKLLEQDRPMFESEHKPGAMVPNPRGRAIDRQFAALENDVTLEVATDTAPAPTGGRADAVIPSEFEDRSQWPAVVIGPAFGGTPHQPHYFNDCPIGDTTVRPVNSEAAFEQYLSNDRSANWSGANAAALLVQPVKFGFDLVALPVRAVLTPPWTTVVTPDYSQPAVEGE